MQMTPRHEGYPHESLTAEAALAVALCAADASADCSALCFALGEAASNLAEPEWRELIPAPNAAGEIRGTDGRAWRMSSPEAVAINFTRPAPVDANHSTELLAPNGGESPARGWVEKLEVRKGAVWGLIAWNARGQQEVANKEYRFLSPVFRYDPKTLEIKKLTSVALVNEPNFPLALNRANDQENPPVDEVIRIALGLPEKATADQAVTAINSMRSSLTQPPPLDKFVPRADYDTALNRAQTAEQQLAASNKAALDAQVDTAIEAALKAGKITPATVEYHKAMCAAEGGLERFKAFVAAAATVADPTNLGGKTPPGADPTAMNAAAKTVAAMFGNSAEDLKKHGQEENA